METVKILRIDYPLKDLLYIEGVNNMSVFTFSDGECVIYSKCLKNHVLPDNFFRIHKHVIVNRDHIKEAIGNRILMENNHGITIARRRLTRFKLWNQPK